MNTKLENLKLRSLSILILKSELILISKCFEWYLMILYLSYSENFQSDAYGFFSSETSSTSELSTWRIIHSPGMSDCEIFECDSDDGIMADSSIMARFISAVLLRICFGSDLTKADPTWEEEGNRLNFIFNRFLYSF